MEAMTLTELFKINPIVITILFLCSVVMLMCLFERSIAYMRIGTLNSGLMDRIRTMLRQGQVKEAVALSSRDSNFFSHALHVGLNAAHMPKEEMENVFALYRMKLQALLGKRLSILGTLAFVGPLIGLFGTVLGIMRAFRDLALSGAGGPTVVAKGIAEALVTTAGGIGVAMVAAVFYNMFTAISRARLQSYDQFSQEVGILVYAEKGHR